MVSPDLRRSAQNHRPVHAIGWFDGRFGYNIHTRNFFEQLSRYLPVVASPLLGTEGPWRADRETLIRSNNLTPRATIALLYGDMMEVLDNAPGRRIAYTVWESTVYPRNWLEKLEKADEVWLPTSWGRKVLIQNGVPETRIKVVPEGVDPALFNPDTAATKALSGFSGFKFLNVGRFEERKGTELLIKCFDEAFNGNEDVRLILACDNHHDPEFDIARTLRDMRLRRPDRIVFIPPVKSHARFAELYRACDVFVSPFRAEGWGLPVCEAMACGLPVIATGYSGPTEFMSDFAYRIDYSLSEIPENVHAGLKRNGGLWADPNREHLILLMRHVFRNREEAFNKGLSGARHISDHFTWQHSARLAADLLSE